MSPQNPTSQQSPPPPSLAARLKDRVAIVTGAADGIGLACARRLYGEGARVLLADLHDDALGRALDSIAPGRPPALVAVPCNVTDEPQVQRCVARALTAFGRLDIIVNNAGVMTFKRLIELDAQDWRRVLDVDLLGAFHFIKYGLTQMTRGGSIVNVSSIHAIETSPLVAPYAAAKAALVSLTRSAAIEAKPLGIRVNAVLPGAVDTPMLRQNPNIRSGAEVVDPSYVGRPEDLAAVIAFLASADAAFVQGAAIVVDGGRLDKL